jgi:hypothetical protein
MNKGTVPIVPMVFRTFLNHLSSSCFTFTADVSKAVTSRKVAGSDPDKLTDFFQVT